MNNSITFYITNKHVACYKNVTRAYSPERIKDVKTGECHCTVTSRPGQATRKEKGSSAPAASTAKRGGACTSSTPGEGSPSFPSPSCPEWPSTTDLLVPARVFQAWQGLLFLGFGLSCLGI